MANISKNSKEQTNQYFGITYYNYSHLAKKLFFNEFFGIKFLKKIS